MSIKKVILFGIVLAIVSFIIHFISAYAVEMPYYQDPQTASLWSTIMMPTAAAPPMSFIIISFIFGIIGGILFGGVYGVLKAGIPGKRKGLLFGFLIFLIAQLPSAMMMVLILNIPPALIAIWTIDGLVIYLLGGMLAEKIIK